MLCWEKLPDHIRHLPPDRRQRIRKNPLSGTVAEGALFDQEIGLEGMIFPFVLRYRGSSDYFPVQLKSVLKWWEDEGFFIGGAGATGKGFFSLENVKYHKWPLENGDLKSYIKQIGCRGREDHIENKYVCATPSGGNVASPWRRIGLRFSFAGPVLINDPIRALLPDSNRVSSKNASPNAVFFKKTIIEEVSGGGYIEKQVFALKSESVRGFFRSAVGQNRELLTLDHEDCQCELCGLFGSEHQEGKIRFGDLALIEPANTPEKFIDHVSVDRFTGGVVEKFNDQPLVGSPAKPLGFEGCIWVHRSVREEKDLRLALESGIKDIRNGLHFIGGRGGIGYGWIKDIALNGAKWLRKSLDEGNVVAPQQALLREESVSLPQVRPLALQANNRYYPHYFLPPYKGERGYPVRRVRLPIGHDRFESGLFSGTIRCTLTTRSPLIIPDTESSDAYGLNQNVKGHKSHRFFSLNGETMIPGAPLRAMVSSVYEAITNSCFRVMNQKERLSRRMDATPGILKDYKPGRVIDNPDKGLFIKEMRSYRLPLYDSGDLSGLEKNTKDLIERCPDQEEKILAAHRVNQQIAEAAVANREFLLNECSEEQRRRILAGKETVSFESEHAGNSNPNDEIATLCRIGLEGYVKLAGPNNANVANTDVGDSGYEKGWEQDRLEFILNDANLRSSNKKQYPRPVLKCIKDGKEYTITKRCERIFRAAGRSVPVSEKNKRDYRQILKEYRKYRNDIAPAFQTEFSSDSELQDGDLVYFKEGEDTNGQPAIDSIIPVVISREVDAEAIGEKLPFNLRPCARVCLEDCDSCVATDCSIPIYREGSAGMGLCPACRLFGTQTYKGRVSFGFAALTGNGSDIDVWVRQTMPAGGESDYVTLPLLERPRPTWVLPTTNERIPGRKFYVHHNGWQTVLNGFAPGAGDNRQISANENNASFQTIAPNQTFAFEIKIKNLHEWELGLLLYSLEQEPGLGHKLGRGKPFGFGSVAVHVDEMRRRQDSDNWEIWNEDSLKARKATLKTIGWDELKKNLLKMKDPGTEPEHIVKLRKLLEIPQADCNVYYPSLDEYVRLKKNYGYRPNEKLKEPWSPLPL